MRSNIRRGLVFFLFLAALAGLIGLKFVPSNHAEESGDETELEPRLLVTVHVVGPERLVERLSTTGTLRANEQIEVVSEISGKVVEITFDEGSRVEAGKVLVVIDDTELVAQRRRVIHQLELAQRREARQQELYADGVISEEDYEEALSRRNVLDAELALIDAQLEKTRIRAPFAGTVGLRFVSLGSFLSPQTKIATLQDLDPVKLDFAVPEKYAGQVEVGDQVRFRVSGFDQDFQGEIYAIEPSVDRETRSLSLRAQSPNPGDRLLPGAFADVELAIREVENGLSVPALAVVPELGGKKVYVYENGTAVARQVETGLRSSEWVEITSGIEPGERVITSGIQLLQPGREVEIAGTEKPIEEDRMEEGRMESAE